MPLMADAISPDGNLVAYPDATHKVVNLLSNTVTIVSGGTFPLNLGVHFSNDGRFLVYSATGTNAAADTNSLADIYLYDVQAGTNFLISQNYYNGGALNGRSDFPAISGDGRFIAYRSAASNNVPADFNGVPDLLLYDRSNAVTYEVTPSLGGNWTANNRSFAPTFSADGKSLVFASLASDAAPQALNTSCELFELSLNGASVITTNSDGSPVSVSGLQLQFPPGTTSFLNPMLNWPVTAGTFYQVQYKNNLTDPDWLNLTGDATILGNLGQVYDLAPAAGSRFYRVILDQ
jgi:Tol biopolymer transport system component